MARHDKPTDENKYRQGNICKPTNIDDIVELLVDHGCPPNCPTDKTPCNDSDPQCDSCWKDYITKGHQRAEPVESLEEVREMAFNHLLKTKIVLYGESDGLLRKQRSFDYIDEAKAYLRGLLDTDRGGKV